MIFLVTFEGDEIIKNYGKLRIEVATFLLDNVMRVVLESGCNRKWDQVFVRIQKFGEESWVLEKGKCEKRDDEKRNWKIGKRKLESRWVGIISKEFTPSPTQKHTHYYKRG